MTNTTTGDNGMKKCEYCGNYHTHSMDMCRDMTIRRVSPQINPTIPFLYFNNDMIMTEINTLKYRIEIMEKILRRIEEKL